MTNKERNDWIKELFAIYQEIKERYANGERFPHQIPQRWRMVRIEKAMAEIRAGNAERGICIECEKSIPKKRMLAFPEAIWCVNCAEIFEFQQQNKRRRHHMRLDVPVAIK
ncbi:hypothetical protein GF391_01515 [Candidatus Uhrbacteria bacterium]|nr:hypothetical protein [Candidatus Uhrbacteria bacterium]